MKSNDITLDSILSIISTGNTFDVLADLVKDMELELVDVKVE